MKKLLLLTFVVLSTCLCYGQKIRFTDTSNSWGIQRSSGWPLWVSYGSIYASGQIDQKGITYTNIVGLGLCRDDTISNKVYIIKSSDTVEKTLYDYTLQIGDTFAYHFFYLPHDAKGVVVEIDSILIGGNYYKKWKLNNLDPYIYSTIIIEGIGVWIWSTFEQARKTICFKQNGNIITVPNYIDAASCKLSVSNTNTEEKTFSIYPHPANQFSNITFPYTIQSGSLIITDIFGRVVSRKTISNQSVITLGELPIRGIYFYSIIETATGNKFSSRFVYQ